ncbi:MAG TPA: glycosyltransferase family 1 protein [Rhodocyclaceae bacterium]|nr:glycosyltransferase family 1 protein [Rhodocyclaceae bacterium]HMV52901.1 glycosyltransferase family 1 protein [Rhodocyclaceae bacterium]HMZ83172.1 glycosyltransferase family 1 protein [Rhodocyclaceae bacterium]HNA04709.1 glycosyltransferase family 1 protein [Rhodocyclaceae bacterium]HNB79630.1 glycosyltransferase family 1 protein [Rhodocyclaceae bacterium]
MDTRTVEPRYDSGLKAGLRIAVVTETYPPEINGVAITSGRQVEGLLALGHRVQLIRPQQQHDDQPIRNEAFSEILIRGLPIPRYPQLRLGLPAAGRLESLWRSDPPDAVQVVTEGPLGWSAVTAARRLGLPVVSEFHTNFDAYSAHYGAGWLRQAVGGYLCHFHNRADLTLVPTRELQKTLLRAGYHGVEVVSRGVDCSLFNPGRRRPALRTAWGVGADDLVVIHVGRLAPEKNLPLLMRAFDAITASRTSAKLLLVGDGPSRAQLEAQARPNVVFAGMRRGEDLANHFASADLFLYPSITETFGNVTGEALASGLPVVAYDYAAAALLVRDGHNGLHVRFDDGDAFVKAAVRASRAECLAHLRQRTAASVSHLGWRTAVERLVEKLHTAIARKRQHAKAHAKLDSAAH